MAKKKQKLFDRDTINNLERFKDQFSRAKHNNYVLPMQAKDKKYIGELYRDYIDSEYIPCAVCSSYYKIFKALGELYDKSMQELKKENDKKETEVIKPK